MNTTIKKHIHKRLLIGDELLNMANKYAMIMNTSEFMTCLREGKLPQERYMSFIASMYPIVLGFNGSLIRSLLKLNHETQYRMVLNLAEQLKEEQQHNQLWREMLSLFGINFHAISEAKKVYTDRFSDDARNQMMYGVIRVTRADINALPTSYPEAIFPQAVLALEQHLGMTATEADLSFWVHFACQSAIEMIIYNVVTTSIYPAVAGNPLFDIGVNATQWWKEHASVVDGSTHRTSEEKHLQMSQIALNRNQEANSNRQVILSMAEDAMCLFAATVIEQDLAFPQFPIRLFLDR